MSERVDAFRAWLSAAERNSFNEQMTTLEERKRAELEFHDKYRTAGADEARSEEYERRYGNRKYYQATARSTSYVESWVSRHAPGHVFLDYACGHGKFARSAARAGADLVVGLDISGTTVQNARIAAETEGLRTKVFFIQADAENTGLPAQSVDTVICSGMLHHLDLSYAFPELRRILAPGGRILAVEALGHNPAIQLYRRLTPQMRTAWESEHIIKVADLRFARRFFRIGEVRYWHMAEVLVPYLKWAQPALRLLDHGLEKTPGLQLLPWMITFELIRVD